MRIFHHHSTAQARSVHTGTRLCRKHFPNDSDSVTSASTDFRHQKVITLAFNQIQKKYQFFPPYFFRQLSPPLPIPENIQSTYLKPNTARQYLENQLTQRPLNRMTPTSTTNMEMVWTIFVGEASHKGLRGQGVGSRGVNHWWVCLRAPHAFWQGQLGGLYAVLCWSLQTLKSQS